MTNQSIKHPATGTPHSCEVCDTVFTPIDIRWRRTCGRKCAARLRITEGTQSVSRLPSLQTRLKRWVKRKQKEFKKHLYLCDQCGNTGATKASRCKRCKERLSSSTLDKVIQRVKYWLENQNKQCDSVGCEGLSVLGSSKCCECRKENNRTLSRQCNHRRRCRKHGSGYEAGVNAKSIAKRDGVLCAYCKCKTTKWDGQWRPTLRTIDHVIPLASGGDHVMSNVVIACSLCNSIKGDR